MKDEHGIEWGQISWLPDGLKSADIKYQWATTHATRLNLLLENFEKREWWRPEQSSDLAKGMVRIIILEHPPLEIGLIIGDIVHSLRASLDYAACALVRIVDSTANVRDVYFPFGREGVPLNSTERKAIGITGDVGLGWISHSREIAGEPLAVLHRASNQDKHRLILPTSFRQMPLKVEIDPVTNTAEFIPDKNNINVWNRPVADGDVVSMDGMISLRLGFHIEGDPAPHPLAVVERMFWATHVALQCMFNAAKALLAQRG